MGRPVRGASLSLPGGSSDLEFIGQNLTTDLRRAHESSLLDRYYPALRANGVRDYGFDRCRDDYHRGLVTATGIAFQGFGLTEQMIADGPGDVSDE